MDENISVTFQAIGITSLVAILIVLILFAILGIDRVSRHNRYLLSCEVVEIDYSTRRVISQCSENILPEYPKWVKSH